jgi:hypothetical protein
VRSTERKALLFLVAREAGLSAPRPLPSPCSIQQICETSGNTSAFFFDPFCRRFSGGTSSASYFDRHSVVGFLVAILRASSISFVDGFLQAILRTPSIRSLVSLPEEVVATTALLRRAKLGLPSYYNITCVDERSQAIDKTVSRALMIVSSCVSICSIWTYPAFACQSSALWTLFRLALDPYSFLRHYNNRQLRQIEKKFLY